MAFVYISEGKIREALAAERPRLWDRMKATDTRNGSPSGRWNGTTLPPAAEWSYSQPRIKEAAGDNMIRGLSSKLRVSSTAEWMRGRARVTTIATRGQRAD